MFRECRRGTSPCLPVSYAYASQLLRFEVFQFGGFDLENLTATSFSKANSPIFDVVRGAEHQCWTSWPDRQWRSSSFQEYKKVRVSRDLWLWHWPWPWAHPGCKLTWSPSCESLVAIRPFMCENLRRSDLRKSLQMDGQTTDASPLH